MKKIIAAGLFLISLALATPAHAIEPCCQVCYTNWQQGSLTWVFEDTDVWLAITRAGEGDNPVDCFSGETTCNILRCDVTQESELICKMSELPVSHCVNVLVEYCDNNDGTFTIPVVREIEFESIGDCPEP